MAASGTAGTMTLDNSTVSGNSATFAGGIRNHPSGTITLTNSTVSGNSATSLGGGIDNEGTMTLTNNTVNDNSAREGGREGGGIYNIGTASMANTTVSGNTVTHYGGGLWVHDATNVINTIIANNLSGTDCATFLI